MFFDSPITLIALRPLYGTYGRVIEGQHFQVNAEDAEQLEAAGLAERYRAPSKLSVEKTKALWSRAISRQPKLAQRREADGV